MTSAIKFNRFIYLLSLLAVVACAPSADDSLSPDAVFVKYYGDLSTHRLYDIVVKDNGDFVLFGTRKVDGDPLGANFYIVHTDPGGNLLQDLVLDVNETEDIAAKIKVISDGYLIVGSVADLDEALIPQAKKLYWAHISEDLTLDTLTGDRNPVLSQTILSADELNSNAINTNDNEEIVGTDILLTQNDSVLVAGYSDVVAPNELTKPSNLQKQMFVQKASLGGGVRWNKTAGYSNSDELAVAIYEQFDGSIILVGSASNVLSGEGQGGTNVCVMYFNPQMTAQYNAPLFGVTITDEQGTEILDYNEVPAGVYRSNPNTGSMVITGTASFGPASHPFIMTVTESGSLVSADTLTSNFATGNSFGSGVTRTLTNDHIVVGTTLSWRDQAAGGEDATTKGDEIMFIRSNQFSTTRSQYSRNYGTASGNDEAMAVRTLEDGSIAIGGTTDFGSGVALFTLMKVNDKGELRE